MSCHKYILAVLAPLLFSACALPVRKVPLPAVPAAPVKRTSVIALSAEDTNKVEGLYYKAVGAYSNNDMAAALKYVDEISTLYPSYPPAAELRDKIKSVSVADKLPPPQKP